MLKQHPMIYIIERNNDTNVKYILIIKSLFYSIKITADVIKIYLLKIS